MKTCTKCKTTYQDEYRNFRKRGSSWFSWCKSCERIANLERHKKTYIPKPRKEIIKKSKDQISKEAKARMLKFRYGISEEFYLEMYEQQNKACAICEVSKPLGGNGGLVIDHDHVTGKVRGLLCNSCNTAIGKLKESKVLFLKSLKYLGLIDQ